MNAFDQNKTALLICAVVIAVPMVFLETISSMIHVWNVNETFTHGYLIFPITLWLLWRNRQTIANVDVQPEPRVLALLLPLLAAWYVSTIVSVQVTQQLAMVSMIPVLVWLIFGRRMLLANLFPLLFLFFAIPIGQGLIPPMMEFTADFTVGLLRLTGVPVFRDGLFFSLPTGNWSVVEECSGVRYLIASISLGTIYAYLSYQSYLKRLLFVVFAIVLPIIANGLRAYGIVMIGHFSDMQLATGADHLVYGWVFFGFVIFIMFFVGSYWADPPTTDASEANSNEVILRIIQFPGYPWRFNFRTSQGRVHFSSGAHFQSADSG